MGDATAIVVALLLLAGNAFFVGSEFALVSARRTQVEPSVEAGSRAARIALRGMDNVSLMMAGSQLGITICSLALGAVGEPAVAHLLEPLFETLGVPDAALHLVALALALLVVTTLHMVIGEMVPKNIALARPRRSALTFGPPLYAIVTVLKPVVALLNEMANVVLRALRVQPQEEVTSVFTADEVAAFVEESRREGLIDDTEHELLRGALTFEEGAIRDVVIPPGDLVAVRQDATVAELEATCAETGLSRFPVLDGNVDLVGYVHVRDLLGIDDARRAAPVSEGWIRALATVRTEQSLREALVLMQAHNAHMARALDSQTDEVVGVVTLQDVLEQLVGDMADSGQQTGPTTATSTD